MEPKSTVGYRRTNVIKKQHNKRMKSGRPSPAAYAQAVGRLNNALDLHLMTWTYTYMTWTHT